MSQDLYRANCPFDKKFPSELIKDDTYFMQLAYNQAIDAWGQYEVPIGAVIVHKDSVIASAHNQVEATKDPTAHAEMIAITQAAQKLGDWRLNTCTLYVTKEPCFMCTGASILGRIQRVVYASADPKTGCLHDQWALHQHPGFNHALVITSGILEIECTLLLQTFFRQRRQAGSMCKPSVQP